MSTQLFYNDRLILSGQPTPLVGRTDNMVLFGERWAEQVQISLRGQITGCALDFGGLVSEQEELLSIFSKDFQSFRVVEDGVELFSLPYVQILPIKFPSSNYVGLINYEITLQGYPEDLFSGHYGVVDPEDSWEFQETEDKRLRITRTVAARGFNTSSGNSNGYENARQFVKGRTGDNTFLSPYFIHTSPGMVPCLKTIREDHNSFNGTCKITTTYEADLYYNNDGILRYTTKFDCSSTEGIAKVSVDGEILGCSNASLAEVRNRYASFSVYGAALETYQDCTSQTDLNPNYIRSGVVEDGRYPKLTFQAEFDNFTGSSTFFNYLANVTSGDNDIVNVNVDGTIGARGDIKARWTRVNAYYHNDLNMFGIADAAYNEFVGNSYPIDLNPYALNSGVSFNEYVAEIKVNATWDNRVVEVDGFSSLNYDLEFGPSLQKVVARPLATTSSGPICADPYYVVDVGYKNRCIFGINGNGQINCGGSSATAISNLKQFANAQFNEYCPSTRAIIEKNTIATGSNGNITFSFTWSAESANNVVSPRTNYLDINNLRLK
jgi:hypothetical protein